MDLNFGIFQTLLATITQYSDDKRNIFKPTCKSKSGWSTSEKKMMVTSFKHTIELSIHGLKVPWMLDIAFRHIEPFALTVSRTFLCIQALEDCFYLSCHRSKCPTIFEVALARGSDAEHLLYKDHQVEHSPSQAQHWLEIAWACVLNLWTA